MIKTCGKVNLVELMKQRTHHSETEGGTVIIFFIIFVCDDNVKAEDWTRKYILSDKHICIYLFNFVPVAKINK